MSDTTAILDRILSLKAQMQELISDPEAFRPLPQRILALFGEFEPNPESPDEPFLNGELFTIGTPDETAEMIGMMITAVLDNYKESEEAQSLVVGTILESLKDYLDFEEE